MAGNGFTNAATGSGDNGYLVLQGVVGGGHKILEIINQIILSEMRPSGNRFFPIQKAGQKNYGWE
jgi:hypothetical protein